MPADHVSKCSWRGRLAARTWPIVALTALPFVGELLIESSLIMRMRMSLESSIEKWR